MLFSFCIFILCLTFSHPKIKSRVFFSMSFVYNWTFVLLEFFNWTQIVFQCVLTGTFDRLVYVQFRLHENHENRSSDCASDRIDWQMAMYIFETFRNEESRQFSVSISMSLITIWMVLILSNDENPIKLHLSFLLSAFRSLF